MADENKKPFSMMASMRRELALDKGKDKPIEERDDEPMMVASMKSLLKQEGKI